MASEPYLISKQRACYGAPLFFNRLDPTPECIPDKYTTFFRKRWDALATDPCKTKPPNRDYSNYCKLNPEVNRNIKDDGDVDEICIPANQTGVSDYTATFTVPWSHNNIDDCCKAQCPCNKDGMVCPGKKPCCQIQCKEREPLPPLDECTTHRHFFTPKPVPPRPQRRVEPYDPCECPMDGATTYRVDYPHKKCIPNGPVAAAVTKHGMWSMDQFSMDPFQEETEHLAQYPEKCETKRCMILPQGNLSSGAGPFARASETCYQYGPKSAQYPQIPDWVLTEPVWIPPCPPLDDCTTYKHFFPRYELPTCPPETIAVQSPNAIPFSTMCDHNMWYTCCDPKVEQFTPVEIKDNDPWPYVRPCPIRYQDNLKTDPCAPFRDDTTQKADYTPKRRCGKRHNYAPCAGYTPPIQPFNDNTTNRVAFRAYNKDEYKCAKFNAGNPNGKFWGPFKCPPSVDKCLPRFPAPYGHPIKPFTRICPCGPFDDRSTYHQDFKFRSKETVKALEEEMCQQPNIPKGVSVSRHDFVKQEGQKAEKMPPPDNKGHRCVAPCSYRDLDTLYRMQFKDFWRMERSKLELYRGHRDDAAAILKLKAERENCQQEPEAFEIKAMPPGTTVEDVLQALEMRDKSNNNNNC